VTAINQKLLTKMIKKVIGLFISDKFLSLSLRAQGFPQDCCRKESIFGYMYAKAKACFG